LASEDKEKSREVIMSETNPELNQLVDETKQIAVDTTNTFGALTPAQLNWKPGEQRWSVAQCLEHLIVANQGFFPIFEAIVKGEHKTRTMERIPVLPKLWGKLIVSSQRPTSTRKYKAPKRFQPAQSKLRDTIVKDFVDQQERVLEFMKASKGLDLNALIITSPVASFITYSLMDAYRLIVVHEQRHILQAKRVTAEANFPTRQNQA
jgi:hypothetical protein